MLQIEDNSALRLCLLRDLARRLRWSGLVYALFAGLFSLNLATQVRPAALSLSGLLAVLGFMRTIVAHRVIDRQEPERDGAWLIRITQIQGATFGVFVAWGIWNVWGLVIPECILVVGVTGISSFSASLFAPVPRLAWLNVSAQVLPVYLWTWCALPRYGWLLEALVVIHAVAVWQLIQMNGTHLRQMFLDQLTLEEQSEDLRRARDAAQRADSAKLSFLANMSHEIRTPLNGIMGLVELLNSATLGREERELLADIGRSGNHLLSILNDILDMAKVTAGKLTPERAPFDLPQLIRDIVSPAAALAEAKQLRFHLRLPPDLPQQVNGDSVRTRQVLSNLLSNAVKFTPSGEVGLSVEMPLPGRIRFDVSDTGIGLSLEQRQSLFQEFHQVDSSTTRKFGGTGLGLAISHRLAELMGGRLWVESRLGEGSTFMVELPLTAAEIPAPGAAAEVPVVLELPRGLRVLVVEDNLINQKVTSAMLSRAGAHVDIAENGRVAVQRHQACPYDMILMDCQMPEMDGYEATALIRSLPGDASQVRIIGVTANAFAEDRDRCLRVGMDAYVAKPLSRQSLLAAVSQSALAR